MFCRSSFHSLGDDVLQLEVRDSTKAGSLPLPHVTQCWNMLSEQNFCVQVELRSIPALFFPFCCPHAQSMYLVQHLVSRELFSPAL